MLYAVVRTEESYSTSVVEINWVSVIEGEDFSDIVKTARKIFNDSLPHETSPLRHKTSLDNHKGTFRFSIPAEYIAFSGYVINHPRDPNAEYDEFGFVIERRDFEYNLTSQNEKAILSKIQLIKSLQSVDHNIQSTMMNL